MTEDERIELGHYCEALLLQEHFNVVAQHFDRQCFEHFMTSQTPTEREEVYARLTGFRDFLIHLRAYVDGKNQLIDAIQAPSTDDDAPIEGIY